MNSIMKVLLLSLILWTQISDANAHQKNDIKVLNTYIKNDQVNELRTALKSVRKMAVDPSVQSALMITAIDARNLEALRTLLDWGVDVNLSLSFTIEGKKTDFTPLDYAIGNRNNQTIVELLIKNGADVNRHYNGVLLALNFALASHQFAIANLLLDKGANSDVNTSGLRPIMELVLSTEESDSAEMLGLLDKLISNGANINTRALRGTTALGIAVIREKVYAVNALLERGADPNTVNEKGETMLELATKRKNTAIASLLTKYGAR
ncbi:MULTISPECIES: ankyrin repeat domain-containing protein [unclassified Undibacterium]|uniref:ankyrin repeat domain-containing protein n=1 Tax=unclassified Undibacterium TaxID=2630295 RepID=UPI00339AD516